MPREDAARDLGGPAANDLRRTLEPPSVALLLYFSRSPVVRSATDAADPCRR